MDIIIGWQGYKTEFNGAEIVMQVRPLTRQGFLLLSPHMGTFQAIADDVSDGFAAQSKVLELQGVCQELFKTHLRNLDGFTINGKPPTVEELTDESVFATLCIDIVGKLFSISVLDKDQAKNSGGQSTNQNDMEAA